MATVRSGRYFQQKRQAALKQRQFERQQREYENTPVKANNRALIMGGNARVCPPGYSRVGSQCYPMKQKTAMRENIAKKNQKHRSGRQSLILTSELGVKDTLG